MIPHRFHSALLIFFIGVIFLSAGQINAQSSVDPTYNGVPSLPLWMEGDPAPAQRQAIQADGKILIWGG
ncbi:MAG TPA: hypothetical protein VGQ55_01795, partial [Pyrinomonadaceae bacterium]|nr:hypothetical protein [Pyrinomonadaceae bacterium]